MTSPKKVDFIVPALNAESTIRKCLQSILKQNCPGIELQVYLVDNGSLDKTVAMIEDLPITILHCSQKGRSQARNFGTKHSSADWIAFIDSDVVLEESWLRHMLQQTRLPVVGSVHGQIISAGERELDRYRFARKYHQSAGTFIETEGPRMDFPLLNTAACLVNRRALTQVGGFNEELIRSEDYDLSLRLLIQGYSSMASLEAKAWVYFEGGPADYFKRTFSATYYGVHFLHRYLAFRRQNLLFDIIDLRPSFHVFSTIDKMAKFAGGLCYLLKSFRADPLLKYELKQFKLNLLLPKLTFEEKRYRFSMSKRFYLSPRSLHIYGIRGFRFFRGRSAGEVDFFYRYLNDKLTEQDLLTHRELIHLLIAEKILVVD